MPQQIAERGSLLEATATSTGSGTRRMIQIITPGWGSSGYYSPEVLQEAATNRVIPAGTHMFLDHASASENADRPERSVRDIAAVLVEDARWDGSRLVGEARILGTYADMIDDLAPHIGVSISGSATDITVGEAEGRTGPIIEGLAYVNSVDFVTRAGRGGAVLQVMESANPVREARNIGQWVESRIHRDFTVMADDMAGDGRLTREERIGLSSAIGDALAAFVSALEANQPQLYARDIWDDPQDTVAAAIEAETLALTTQLDALETENSRLVAEVRVLEARANEAPTNVPVNRPDGNTTEESEEDTMPQIEESRLAQLEADAGRLTTVEAERDTAINERDTARRERDAERAVGRARTLIATNEARRTAGIEFSSLEERGLLAGITVDADGALDEAAFQAAVDTAVAEATTARGTGAVTGHGRTQETGTTVTESDIDRAVGSAFGRQVKEA